MPNGDDAIQRGLRGGFRGTGFCHVAKELVPYFIPHGVETLDADGLVCDQHDLPVDVVLSMFDDNVGFRLGNRRSVLRGA